MTNDAAAQAVAGVDHAAGQSHKVGSRRVLHLCHSNRLAKDHAHPAHQPGATAGKDPLGASQIERDDRGSGGERHPRHTSLGLIALARLGYAAAGEDHDQAIVRKDALTEGSCFLGILGSAFDPDMAHPPQQATEHGLAEQKLGRQEADIATEAAEQQDRVDRAGVIAGQDHPAVSWHVPAADLLDSDEDLDAGRHH